MTGAAIARNSRHTLTPGKLNGLSVMNAIAAVFKPFRHHAMARIRPVGTPSIKMGRRTVAIEANDGGIGNETPLWPGRSGPTIITAMSTGAMPFANAASRDTNGLTTVKPDTTDGSVISSR